MPDFEQRKRRSLTDQQLYEEYHNIGKNSSFSSAKNKKKKKGKGAAASKAVKKNVSADKAAERREAARAHSPKDEIGSSPKKSASGGGSAAAGGTGSSRGYSAGRKNSPTTNGRSREETERAVATAKKSKTFAGKKSTLLKGKKKKTAAKSDGSVGKKSKKRQGKYTLYYIFIGVVVVVALSILSATVLFNIGVFVVNGETRYSDEEIIKACGIEEGENLLRINTGRGAERIVESLVYIDSAEIHRGFPNRLTIIVKPAVPAAAYTYGGKYYVTSEGNRLLEIADTPADYPIVKGYLFDPEEMPKEGDYLKEDGEKRLSLVNSVTSYMKKYGLNKSCVIDITDTLEITVTYDDRIEMTLGTSTALESKINNAAHLIHSEIAENERCTLNLTNPDRAGKRPIRDNDDSGDNGYVVPEETTAPESTENPDGTPE